MNGNWSVQLRVFESNMQFSGEAKFMVRDNERLTKVRIEKGGKAVNLIASKAWQNFTSSIHPGLFRRLGIKQRVSSEIPSSELCLVPRRYDRRPKIASKRLQCHKLLISIRHYEKVLSRLADGATSEDLIKSADEAIKKKGYNICDSLVHSFGTDLGFPELGTSNSVYANPSYEFKENMAIVIQPNPVYRNKFGLQLGNLCLVGKSKSVSIQRFPLKFITISWKLRFWLNRVPLH